MANPGKAESREPKRVVDPYNVVPTFYGVNIESVGNTVEISRVRNSRGGIAKGLSEGARSSNMAGSFLDDLF